MDWLGQILALVFFLAAKHIPRNLAGHGYQEPRVQKVLASHVT